MYPINLVLQGRSCAVVGGGAVALRKVVSLLAEGAVVTVIAPQLISELAALAGQGDLIWKNCRYGAGMLQGFFIVVCAADDAAANHAAAAEAHASGALVNAASQPEYSDFFVPAKIQRGDFLLTVSTGGKSPAFAHMLRKRLEQEFGDTYGIWLERLSGLRRQMKERLQESSERQAFWRFALDEQILELVVQQKFDEAEAGVQDAINRFGTKS